MGALIPLIPLAAIPNCGGRRVLKNGLDLAVFRVDNAVYAIQDSCPHKGASLSNGVVQGKTVACRAHGLRFNLDCDQQGGPPTLPIQRFAVQVVDGIVMLECDTDTGCSTTE
ncbi:Rieske 2Fe-2S domain-containing protein [Rhodoblastus sp. 17X3]|uniref:Rieske (2Fe-2S) protein n=1 Tax=Rhodoblastus sp. 17X3 TaxID=3047026 RepID=UPI0024B64998|nr:Rieske 2Fe-2S domain-containing protein [Rhodoblastus sp. 17X3]MDI9850239.1 Rieske 2Fe-2S domain-containing protein [Rhodoblastus sp. 17X3]